MFSWLRSFLYPTEEEKKFFEAIDKLYEEYDVRISPRGGLSKTSKPEFAEKHRQRDRETAEAIKKYLDDGGTIDF